MLLRNDDSARGINCWKTRRRDVNESSGVPPIAINVCVYESEPRNGEGKGINHEK